MWHLAFVHQSHSMSMSSYLLWIQPLGPLLVLPGLAKRGPAAALISAIIPALY